MATHNITINEEGTPTPKDMGRIEREDIVSFFVGKKPILLCLDVQIFGTESIIEIAAEDSVAVRVKLNASHVPSFEYFACRRDENTVNFTCTDVKREVKNPNPNPLYKGDTGGGRVGM